MRELTPKQATFVDEYLKDLNATQAAIRTGYAAWSADVQGARLMGNARIAAEIAARMAAREKRTEITQDRVLLEIARLALFDPRKLFKEDGSPKGITELDDDTAAAIAGLDVVATGNAELGVGQVMKIKIADKNSALEKLARHLGMYNDKLDVNVNLGLAERLARAKERLRNAG